jgi:hypothetical protein
MINHDYIFEYDFDIQALVSEHKEAMIEKFYHDKIENSKGSGYNTGYENKDFDREIGVKFARAVNDNFVINPDRVVESNGLIGTMVYNEFKPIKAWLYCQNDEHFASKAHTHINTSTINAVTYIDVPDGGGALELNIIHETLQLKPDPGKIYFFPYWVVHKPLPQKDKQWRICINLEFFDESRPLRKNGVWW